MYDVHSHLMPGVDDGPKTQEEAIDLLKAAYEDGIRHLVLTPHLNHPLKFTGSDDYERDFERFKKLAGERFPQLELYLGSEVYISRDKLDNLQDIKVMGMNSTSYVLVEFSREITLSDMEHGLSELQTMGYKPIVAHVEVYKAIREQWDALERLQGDGVLFQVNASHLVGRDHKALKSCVVGLLDRGYVSFIASDGHGETRLPLLKEAYDWVCKRYGGRCASQLFLDNPKTMLAGLPVERAKTFAGRNGLRQRFVRLAAVASVVVVIMVGFALNNLAQMRNQDPVAAEADRVDVVNQKSVEQAPVSLAEDVQEKEAEPVAAQGDAQVAETNQINETTVVLSEAAGSTDLQKDSLDFDLEIDAGASEEEKLVQAYVNYLTGLEGKYTSAVDAFYGLIREAAQLEDKVARDQELGRLQDELASLESQSDNEVYKTLYDMQNDLEDKEYDVAIVKTLRAHYVDEKMAVSEKYRAQLEQHIE